MLFKQEHIAMILSGRKTETRRIWKRPQVKVGGIYGCRLGKDMMVKDSDFARIRVIRIFKQRLRDMDDIDAHHEGYNSLREFNEIWVDIYGEWKRTLYVTVIRFELVEDLT